VRAQRGNSPASSEAVERRRKTEEGERKKGEGADQWPRLAEKEKERGARAGPSERQRVAQGSRARASWAEGGSGPRAGERKRGREGSRGKRSWAAVAHAGEGEGKEPERERELGCWAFISFTPSFLFFSIL
jgi:hypothetical protein